MLKPEEKRRINEALTKCNGDKRAAADMLNMPVSRLRDTINNNKDLRAFWTAKGRATTSIEVMGGPMLPDEPKESPAEIEAREEAEFKKHLQDMGQDPKEQEQGLSLARVYGAKINYCVNLMGGGVLKRFLGLMSHSKELEDRYKVGFSGETATADYSNWIIDRTETDKQIASYMKAAVLSQVAREKIKALQAAANGNKGHAKPSFGPKQTNIIARNVQVTG